MTEKKQDFHPLRRASHLVKQNLPGLIGRRDAAWDQAVKLTLSPREAGRSAEARLIVCHNVISLLTIAKEDTGAILQLLSSPDTEVRERKLFSLQELTLNMAETWEKLLSLEQGLFGADTILANFGAADNEAENAVHAGILQKSSSMLLSKLRQTFESAAPRLERYRSYTANSFSPAYAARYRNSYSNYRKLYTGQYPLD